MSIQNYYSNQFFQKIHPALSGEAGFLLSTVSGGIPGMMEPPPPAESRIPVKHFPKPNRTKQKTDLPDFSIGFYSLYVMQDEKKNPIEYKRVKQNAS